MKICYNKNIMIEEKTHTNSKEFVFYKNYTKYVVPKLKELEIERKKTLYTAILLSIGTIVAIFIILAMFFKVPLKQYDFFIINVILLGVILFSIFPIYFIWNNSIKTFKYEIKKKCMSELLKAFGEINWNPEATVITDETIKKSELFGTYNRRTNDDTFSGKYKDVNFVVSESDMQNIRGCGKNRNVWPVFDGVIVSIDSNKAIKNKTIITTKGDINVKNSDPLIWTFVISLPFYCFLACIGTDLKKIILILPLSILLYGLMLVFCKEKEVKEKLNPVILEDPDFNKKYNVYSSDQIESRYLVTTAFMERFKNLHTAFGSIKAKCSFFGNRVMFAITTNKNLFEIGDLLHPLTDMKHINDFMKEISAIYDIIDYFKLDEKTGL